MVSVNTAFPSKTVSTKQQIVILEQQLLSRELRGWIREPSGKVRFSYKVFVCATVCAPTAIRFGRTGNNKQEKNRQGMNGRRSFCIDGDNKQKCI